MEIKTRLTTLIDLLNNQQELVLHREAGIRVLRKMVAEDPNKVLTTTPDLETFQPKVVTVSTRLKEMEEAYQTDLSRYHAYQEMIEEEKGSEEHTKEGTARPHETPTGRTGMEQQ